jgi:hypothetical protein
MSLWDRVRKLEAASPRITHHRSVVQVPWGLKADDYLATLTCPCGRRDCTEQTFGVVVPQRCATVDEWVERYAHYREQNA